MTTTCVVCTVESGHQHPGSILANPRGEIRGTYDELVAAFAWAAQVALDDAREFGIRTAIAAVAADGSWAPSYERVGQYGVRWVGSFTQRRWMQLDLVGRDWVLTWNTGTDAPSWYLGRALLVGRLARVPRLQVAGLVRAGKLTPEDHGRLAALAA